MTASAKAISMEEFIQAMIECGETFDEDIVFEKLDIKDELEIRLFMFAQLLDGTPYKIPKGTKITDTLMTSVITDMITNIICTCLIKRLDFPAMLELARKNIEKIIKREAQK